MDALKTHDELREMGGQFYSVDDNYFCDTISQSWRYVPSLDRYVERLANRPRKRMFLCQQAPALVPAD